jgi:hypothetical protein
LDETYSSVLQAKNQPSTGRIAEDFDDNFKVPTSHCAVMQFPMKDGTISNADG